MHARRCKVIRHARGKVTLAESTSCVTALRLQSENLSNGPFTYKADKTRLRLSAVLQEDEKLVKMKAHTEKCTLLSGTAPVPTGD